MKTPSIRFADDLKDWEEQIKDKDSGKWVCARPMSYRGLSLGVAVAVANGMESIHRAVRRACMESWAEQNITLELSRPPKATGDRVKDHKNDDKYGKQTILSRVTVKEKLEAA